MLMMALHSRCYIFYPRYEKTRNKIFPSYCSQRDKKEVRNFSIRNHTDDSGIEKVHPCNIQILIYSTASLTYKI